MINKTIMLSIIVLVIIALAALFTSCDLPGGKDIFSHKVIVEVTNNSGAAAQMTVGAPLGGASLKDGQTFTRVNVPNGTKEVWEYSWNGSSQTYIIFAGSSVIRTENINSDDGLIQYSFTGTGGTETWTRTN